MDFRVLNMIKYTGVYESLVKLMCEGEIMLPERFLQRMQEMLGDEYRDFLQSFEKKVCFFLALSVNMC